MHNLCWVPCSELSVCGLLVLYSHPKPLSQGAVIILTFQGRKSRLPNFVLGPGSRDEETVGLDFNPSLSEPLNRSV